MLGAPRTVQQARVQQKIDTYRRRRWLRPGFRKACPARLRSYHPPTSPLPATSQTCFEGPFGEVIRATGPMARANPFRFSTKYQDDETDLVYYGYRYYNASTGRWLSCDPYEEVGGNLLSQLSRKQQIAGLARGANVRQGQNGQRTGDCNLYAFVMNRPLAWFDTDGRIPIEGPGPSVPLSLPDPSEPPATREPPIPPHKPGDTWRICCQPVKGYELFQHCDLRWYPCDSSSTEEYPVTYDSKCCKKGIKNESDMKSCFLKHMPIPGGYLPGDNCQSHSLDALIDCCGKSTWKPKPYAYHPHRPIIYGPYF